MTPTNKIATYFIEIYKKYLSNTIFRQNRCSFNESCSTFALKIANSGVDAFGFINIVKHRLKRCGQHYIAVYRGNLVWERAYDKTPKEMIEYCKLLENHEHEEEAEACSIISNYISVLKYKNHPISCECMETLVKLSKNKQGRVRKINDDALLQQIKRKSSIIIGLMISAYFVHILGNYVIVPSVVFMLSIFILLSFLSRIFWFKKLLNKSLISRGEKL